MEEFERFVYPMRLQSATQSTHRRNKAEQCVYIVRLLVSYLQYVAESGETDSIVLVAPTPLLVLLHGELARPTAKLIGEIIPEDLAEHPIEDIVARLWSRKGATLTLHALPATPSH